MIKLLIFMPKFVLTLGIFFSLLSQTQIAAQEPATILHQEIFGMSFTMGLKAGSQTWVEVEASTDLITWTPVGALLSTNDTSTFSVPLKPASTRAELFRIKSAPRAIDDLESNWNSQGLQSYSFTIQNITYNQALQAEVAVTNGIKTILRVVDPISGTEMTDYDPAAFPNIAELFTLLRQAGQDGVYHATALYQNGLNYPREIIIRRVSGIEDQLQKFVIISLRDGE
jgi:hypothetical protein